MSSVEIKTIENLAGSGISYAQAVKAGPFIFLTGHEAHDFETGSRAAVDGTPGFPLYGMPPLRREGDYILDRMSALLAEFGSDLSHGVRLDQYYPTTDPVEPYHQSRRAKFGSYIPPSTSVIMERCFGAASTICTSLIAVMPSDEYKIERVYPKDVAAPSWSGFVPAIICNDFIFVAGQMATDEADGLHPSVRIPNHARWGGSDIRLQTEFLILQKLKPAMEAAGSSLSNIFKAQVYLESADMYPDFVDVWNQHFADSPCAVTVVPTKSYGTVGGIIEINAIGLKADATRTREVVDVDIPGMATYGPCVKVGELILPSGLMAIDDGMFAGSEAAVQFDALSLPGYAQAKAIYGYLDTIREAVGALPENVVRAQYFLADIKQFAGVAAAWKDSYGPQPHPFVCVQTPPLPAAAAALIADFWLCL